MLTKIRRLIKFLTPPPQWRLPVWLLLGVLVGFMLATVRISRAVSYLSDDPEACINCHVMIPQYATWKNSSHSRVATCNDCHVPQDNFFRKYLFKARDGMRHSYVFTSRQEPQAIRATPMAREAIQENCLRCHNNLVHRVSLGETGIISQGGDAPLCWDCHRNTPHGNVRSLSATPFARVPRLSPVFPEWIEIGKESK